MEKLKQAPLINMKTNKSIIITENQKFEKVVEVIYAVRNNLFHGDKGLNIERDRFIVKAGYTLLSPLMEILTKKYLAPITSK